MSTTQDPIRTLPITSNELMLDIIKSVLENEPNYFLLDRQELNDALMENIENLRPDCILLDYLSQSANLFNLIDNISLQFPEVMTVVILPEDKISDANRVILAGARAFIIQPFKQTFFFI